MKTNFLFFLLILGFSQGIQSQETLFPEVNDQWTEANFNMINFSDPVSFTAEEEVVFNDTTFLKIGEGYFREESNRWYARIGLEENESLYLDFNLNVGDTLYFENPFLVDVELAPYLLVVDVETLVALDGIERKKQSLIYLEDEGTAVAEVVEGIGSISGFFTLGQVVYIDGGWTELVCYQSSVSGLIYEDQVPEFMWNGAELSPVIYEDCLWYVGLEELALTSFTVYPTQFTDQIIIETDSNVENYELVIFDLNGKPVYSETLHPNEVRKTIELSYLSSGTYFMSIIGTHTKSKTLILTKVN